jgi:death-on-curing protein
MKTNPIFLTLKEVLEIHADSLAIHGGLDGVRDQGLLESAISMPQAKFGGEYLHTGIHAMGAAYLFHICKNHPFADGNKRTALASAEIFLVQNGFELLTDTDETEQLTLKVAEGSLSKDELTALFKKHVKRKKA